MNLFINYLTFYMLVFIFNNGFAQYVVTYSALNLKTVFVSQVSYTTHEKLQIYTMCV